MVETRARSGGELFTSNNSKEKMYHVSVKSSVSLLHTLHFWLHTSFFLSEAAVLVDLTPLKPGSLP